MEKPFRPFIFIPVRRLGIDATGIPPALIEFVRYGLISALALGVDTALLIALTRLGLGLVWATGLGFAVGMVIVYVLSVRWAFAGRSMVDHRAEFIVFATIGLAGLLLTEVLILGLAALLPLASAKLVTAGAVFLFNFSLRKLLLFTRKNPSTK